MYYILLMTSAGTLLFVGELLLEKAMGKHMSQTCRHKMLVMVMFTYLVPWVWMRGVYGAVKLPFSFSFSFLHRLPFVKGRAVETSGRLVLGDAVFRASDDLVVTSNYSIERLIGYVWISVAVIVVLVRCIIYFSTKSRLQKCARSCEVDVPEELVLRLKKELHIKRRVKVVRIYTEKGSLTLGAIKPVVFLQKNIRADELENVLRHEFIHIARGDLVVKMLMQLVCSLHWFNFFVYWLDRRLDRMCEKACDERVIKGMSDDEKEAYARLIVKYVRAPKKVSKKRNARFGSFFASNKKLVEERVRAIMRTERRKTWEKVVVASIFAVLLFVDSLTALAYPLAYDVDGKSEMVSAAVQGNGMLVQSRIGYTDEYSDFPVLYDEQIITADGEILPVQGETRIFCFHNWKEGYYETHVKDDNGGCTLVRYECVYCDICNKIKVGDKVSTHIYVTCPHDFD